MEDMRISEFRMNITFLEAKPRLTTELDEWGTRYYPDQKRHTIAMCDWQEVKDRPNHSTLVMWGNLKNAGILLWIADVLGEDEARIREAVREAQRAKTGERRRDCILQCSAFRRVIPFTRICELLESPDGWRYEKRMSQSADFNARGVPRMRGGNSLQPGQKAYEKRGNRLPDDRIYENY